jgi:hypothetical protein
MIPRDVGAERPMVPASPLPFLLSDKSKKHEFKNLGSRRLKPAFKRPIFSFPRDCLKEEEAGRLKK